jgi:hypothetical protein
MCYNQTNNGSTLTACKHPPHIDTLMPSSTIRPYTHLTFFGWRPITLQPSARPDLPNPACCHVLLLRLPPRVHRRQRHRAPPKHAKCPRSRADRGPVDLFALAVRVHSPELTEEGRGGLSSGDYTTDISQILVLVAALRTRPESRPDRWFTSMTGPKTALFCILVHAAVSIFLAMVAGRPTDDWDWIDQLIFGIMFFANNYIAIPLSTLAICAAFAYQARESSSRNRDSAGGTSRAGSRGALSTRALPLQGIVSLALAVTWPWRFGFPGDLSEGGWWVVAVWYPLVGWACVNSFVAAVGQFFVLYVVTSAGSDGGAGRMRGERRALLG